MSNPEIDALRAQMAARVRATELPEMRQGFDERMLAYGLAEDVTVSPAEAAGVKAEWTMTPEANPNRVMLYFHGGGYVIGSLDSHRHAVAEMGRAMGGHCLPPRRTCGASPRRGARWRPGLPRFRGFASARG